MDRPLGENVSPSDRTRLAVLGAELPVFGSGSRLLRLESGLTVDVRAESVPGLHARRGSGPSALYRCREQRITLLITGEPGAGCTSGARTGEQRRADPVGGGAGHQRQRG
jgi:hypothetical protein